MKKASNFDQRLLDLFDKYVHGLISRRQFLDKASKFAVGGLTAAGILESLNPKYAKPSRFQKMIRDSRRKRSSTLPLRDREQYGPI